MWRPLFQAARRARTPLMHHPISASVSHAQAALSLRLLHSTRGVAHSGESKDAAAMLGDEATASAVDTSPVGEPAAQEAEDDAAQLEALLEEMRSDPQLLVDGERGSVEGLLAQMGALVKGTREGAGNKPKYGDESTAVYGADVFRALNEPTGFDAYGLPHYPPQLWETMSQFHLEMKPADAAAHAAVYGDVPGMEALHAAGAGAPMGEDGELPPLLEDISVDEVLERFQGACAQGDVRNMQTYARYFEPENRDVLARMTHRDQADRIRRECRRGTPAGLWKLLGLDKHTGGTLTPEAFAETFATLRHKALDDDEYDNMAAELVRIAHESGGTREAPHVLDLERAARRCEAVVCVDRGATNRTLQELASSFGTAFGVMPVADFEAGPWAERSTDDVAWVGAPADALPFRDACINLVTADSALASLSGAEADGMVAEAHRVLRPGGTLAVWEWSKWHMAVGHPVRRGSYWNRLTLAFKRFAEVVQPNFADTPPHMAALAALALPDGFSRVARQAVPMEVDVTMADLLAHMETWPEVAAFREANPRKSDPLMVLEADMCAAIKRDREVLVRPQWKLDVLLAEKAIE